MPSLRYRLTGFVLALMLMPVLVALDLPFTFPNAGIALAGAGGGGGATHGGGASLGRGGSGGVDRDHGMRGNREAVSEAANSTAHAGKAAAQQAGYANLGKAVSSEVHQAQDRTGSPPRRAVGSPRASSRDREEAAPRAARPVKQQARAAGTRRGKGASTAAHAGQRSAHSRSAERHELAIPSGRITTANGRQR